MTISGPYINPHIQSPKKGKTVRLYSKRMANQTMAAPRGSIRQFQKTTTSGFTKFRTKFPWMILMHRGFMVEVGRMAFQRTCSVEWKIFRRRGGNKSWQMVRKERGLSLDKKVQVVRLRRLQAFRVCILTLKVIV